MSQILWFVDSPETQNSKYLENKIVIFSLIKKIMQYTLWAITRQKIIF